VPAYQDITCRVTPVLPSSEVLNHQILMPFSIAAKTNTLFIAQPNGETLISNSQRYVIPIYQRSYSWNEPQIRQLVSDIFFSYQNSEGTVIEEPIFIGTMQFSNGKTAGEKDVVDGQQRLTTLLLLLNVLKHQFPENDDLKALPRNWLSTRVNNGQQQEYLCDALQNDLTPQEESMNPYIRNAILIKSILEELFHGEGMESEFKRPFQSDRFIKHLLSNLYLVVIETNAGLAKTLQIFNAINTAGLDLNGGDIFKIRMYEYLRDKQGEDESAFERISHLYEQIEKRNEELRSSAIHIQEILRIYQHILISEYSLPSTLYTYGVDTFFEGLFETLLNVRAWDLFKGNVSQVELSLLKIENTIRVRYEWEKMQFPTALDATAVHFIRGSRYHHFWNLIILFLYRFREEANYSNKALLFTRQLSKLCIIYSIRFDKQIKEMRRFGYELLDKIIHHSFDEVMFAVNQKIGKPENHSGWYDLNDILAGEITDNWIRKYTICRLSALLEEDYQSNNPHTISLIKEKLFDIPMDVDHIQPYHDRDGALRDDVWKEWEGNINSIGNLILLEQSINRSLNNHPYPKKVQRYLRSSYEVVQKQVQNYPEWNLACCKLRLQKEVDKLMYYLFAD
jgi:hypothetical protein